MKTNMHADNKSYNIVGPLNTLQYAQIENITTNISKIFRILRLMCNLYVTKLRKLLAFIYNI